MWVYLPSEVGFTVGFFDPSGRWHTDSDQATREAAAARVAWLNGSGHAPQPPGRPDISIHDNEVPY